jgi:cell division protein ZapE
MLEAYRAAIADNTLKPDAAQAAAAEKLEALSQALADYRPGFSFFGKKAPPQGVYLWGDVGRGKSMLMDMFFADAPVAPKRRAHFNAFMVQTHARIHAERQRPDSADPIAVVARAIAGEARLLCFDEFQITDIADAMILGRLFEQLFAAGTVIVATSNVAPDRLYEGGLNRQLFLPFIAEIKNRLNVVELNGPSDYRLQRIAGLAVYLTPLSPQADAAMDQAWVRLTDTAKTGSTKTVPMILSVLGRELAIPAAARGVARFDFADLCDKPLAAPDYLEIARHFHTVLIDHIPVMGENMHNVARRFIVLIDTLYDENVKLICSAAAAPEALYPDGISSEAFRRAASRLAEMQSEDYLRKGHGVHGFHD